MKDVAVPVDEELVEDEIEAAVVEAESAEVVEEPAPTAPAASPTAFPTSWGGWAPREHTVVREAEDGVVGGNRGTTVWEPEFGSLYD